MRILRSIFPFFSFQGVLHLFYLSQFWALTVFFMTQARMNPFTTENSAFPLIVGEVYFGLFVLEQKQSNSPLYSM